MTETPFYGHDLDADACEVLLNTRWQPKLALQEGALFTTKWWDYRFEHPVISTYRFADLFGKHTRSIIAKHIDNSPPRITASGKVVQWEPIKSGDIFDPPSDSKRHKYWQQKLSALIKARQVADSYCIPYDFYVSKGLKHWYFGRNYFLERFTLPQPQLLNNVDCIAAIAEVWIDELDARIHHSTHPAYRMSSDPNPFRKDHERSILDQIAKKADPKPSLRKFEALDLISRDAAKARFPSINFPAP